MLLEHAIEIERPPAQVFDFVADPRNDPLWCPRVISCEQSSGDGPAPGARFAALHDPTLQRKHTRTIELLDVDPPHRLATRQEDDIGVFRIAYETEPTATGGTRLKQRDEIEWRIARPFRPVARLIVRRHMGDQLGRLKRLLESGAESASVPAANRA